MTLNGSAPAITLGRALDAAARTLDAAGVEAPRGDARLLLAHAAGVTLTALTTDPARALAPGAASRFAELVRRRRAREPVSHLLGKREFWSRDFIVGPAVLDPRPDSETLIEAALEFLPAGRTADVLDLGVGSGCLLLTLLAERPRARGLGVDLSPAAIDIARRNAARLGVADRASLFVGDWGAAVCGRFELILCNPPYIASGALATLAPEIILHEPRLALDGGPDGYAAYRVIAGQIARLLASGGVGLVEAGSGQMADIVDIFSAEGCHLVAETRDLGGIARCAALGISRPAPRPANDPPRN
ncbi:MAG: peptide chain release factor N(5)-glutamine methyltransferase [Alphaproteobacteria bacterium]